MRTMSEAGGTETESVDRLAAARAGAIADEFSSTLRHDLRNKFASIRNAVFYIQRSLGKSGQLETDPRVARFLTLICEQLESADWLLDQRALHRALGASAVGQVRLGSCVQAALDGRKPG